MPHRGQNNTHTFTALLLAGAACLSAVAQTSRDDGFESLLKQGFELHRQAKFSEAIPILERVRRMEPQDYFANLLLGIDLLRTGKAAESLPRLELAARVKPGEEIPEEYLGEAHASLGHYAQASEAYQRAIERSHDSEEALEAWAGFALERFRQIGENLRSSDAGVQTIRILQPSAANPDAELVCEGSIPALERRLTINSQGGALSAAIRATSRKLSICYAVEAGKAAVLLQFKSKDEAALNLLRGDVLLRLKGDAPAAQEEYRKAIALHPGDPALLARLADAQLTAGDTEAARQSAQASLAIDPHRPDALRTLVSLAMSNREYEQALPWLKQLAIESPGDKTVQVQLGRALAQTGNAAEALAHLAPALASGYPDEKGSLHALEAQVLRQLGREDEATKAAAEAHRLSDAFQAHSKDGAKARPDANK
jgi:tetratricopeptide (TPR) repeat protein